MLSVDHRQSWPAPRLPSFLTRESPRLLAFGGKGGVGKTTCATASALHLCKAFPEKKYLLVSTDPAHSILDSLAGDSPPENLKISELEATESLDLFKVQHGDKLHQIASRGTFLDHEDISQLLDLSLPGLDEIMAFLEILDQVNKGGHDAVIMDTAPTGHTLRLLQMPGLVEKWLEVLDALLGKHRYMQKVFSGAFQPDEVDRFLTDFSNSLENMNFFMKDRQRYRFIPVMTAEGLSVRETASLLYTLAGLDTPLDELLVNRLFPENSCPVCQGVRSRQLGELRSVQDIFSRYSLWAVPMYAWEVRGRQRLETFWDLAGPLKISLPECTRVRSIAPAHVTWSGRRPRISNKLLMFGGKGGVGKTTMACAAAVHLSRAGSGRKILLFSTDPAHSLGECLKTKITSKPGKIAPGLWVAAVNGEQEFAALKQEYHAELERFLKGISPCLDLTFDREAMERIIDLSPPGLDEIMGLCKAMEFYEGNRFDTLIMDASPTGHLIRLLEMPELIDQWLKVFFNIFLKYKAVFNVPGLANRLVKLSRDLKKFCRILSSPEDSSLFAVSILTGMAHEETMDLLRSCNKTGLSVPVLILNMATPESSCGLCTALSLQETVINRKYQESCPDMSLALVYRRDEPRGLDALGELGKAMYGTPGE